MIQRDTKADLIKSLAAFLVVLIHVVATTVINADINTYQWFLANSLDSFARVAPPLFFMISGAFLLSKKEPLIVFFSKRATKLLIPILFWTLLYLTLRVVFGKYNPSGLELAKDILSGDIYYHLWFVNAITIIYLLTPIIRSLTVDKPIVIKVLFTLILFVLSWCGNYLNVISHYFANLLAYVGYFLLGNILFVSKINKSIKITLISFAIYSMASIFTLYKTYQLSDMEHSFIGLYYGYSTINISIASIAIFIFLIQIDITRRATDAIQSIADNGLGIYLVHPLFIKALMTEHAYISSLFEALVLSGTIFIITYACVYLIKKVKYIKILV